jgi:hypothetical protein
MNVNIVDTRDYEEMPQFQERKNKPNSNPDVGFRPKSRCNKQEILNQPNGLQETAPKAQLAEYHLKKQSQFSPAQISVKSCAKKDYEK